MAILVRLVVVYINFIEQSFYNIFRMCFYRFLIDYGILNTSLILMNRMDLGILRIGWMDTKSLAILYLETMEATETKVSSISTIRN